MKLEAVRAYASQFDVERFDKVKHFVSCANGFHGARCGFMYGDLFAMPNPVGADDLVKLVHGGRGSLAPVQLPGAGHKPPV
ncbi:hypothetical protein ABTL45_19745, partial [Acinetobacter baumannii]